MSATVTTSNRLESWVSFLRAHSAITRQMNADLLNAHGLTLNDYEVLLRLSHSDDEMMRRVDLAQSVVLTPSGITRLLDGLESAGFVGRATCKTDARVSYATLTDAGRSKLKEAAVTHLAGVEELFMNRFSSSELDSLAEFLSRLPRLPLGSKDCGGERACSG